MNCTARVCDLPSQVERSNETEGVSTEKLFGPVPSNEPEPVRVLRQLKQARARLRSPRNYERDYEWAQTGSGSFEELLQLETGLKQARPCLSQPAALQRVQTPSSNSFGLVRLAVLHSALLLNFPPPTFLHTHSCVPCALQLPITWIYKNTITFNAR